MQTQTDQQTEGEPAGAIEGAFLGEQFREVLLTQVGAVSIITPASESNGTADWEQIAGAITIGVRCGA